MAGKYDNLFLTYDGKQDFPLGKVVQRFNSDDIPDSNSYYMHWYVPGDYSADEFQVGHPPHSHEAEEIIFTMGIDPKNPTELGAEIEFTMGEEREKYIITKSTAIFIPAGVPHGPWRIKSVDRPFLFLMVEQSKTHTNTWRVDLMSEEDKKKMDWSLWEGGERF